MGYLPVSTYSPRRRKAFNPATKRLVEYGLVGLVIGAVLVAGLQLRPQSVFPSQGTLQIFITDGVPSVELIGPPATTPCHGTCTATSVNVTVSSIEVHTSGINNMTGGWVHLCPNQGSVTYDIMKLNNVTKLLCGAKIQPATITNVRLAVSSIVANITGMGIKTLTLPSGMLEIPLSPLGEVQAGKLTTIIVDLQPHIVCEGTTNCLLTPVLHATTGGPT